MLGLFIGSRYTLSRKQSYLVAFISRISMGAMVLAVALLITVLSVMNGFDTALKKHILSLVPHATMTGFKPSDNWQQYLELAKQESEIDRVEPFSHMAALLMHANHVKQTMLLGVDPEYMDQNAPLRKFVSDENFNALQHDGQIILGQQLAQKLMVDSGGTVKVLLPSESGSLPVSKDFVIAAVVKTGTELDQKIALLYRKNLSLLKGNNPDAVDGLSIYVKDIFNARQIARKLSEKTELFYVKDWSQTHGNLFQAIQMSKTLVLLLVMIIVAVAAFNIVSTLVLAVNDKKPDIAILRTMGCSSRQILSIFFVQGSIIGMVGVFFGGLIGVLLSLTIGDIFYAIEQLSGRALLQTQVYPIDYLPSDIRMTDVVVVCVIAQLLSMLATVFPAIIAMRLQPADVLRYE